MRAGRGGKVWKEEQKQAENSKHCPDGNTTVVPCHDVLTQNPDGRMGKGQDWVHPDSILGLPVSKLTETGEKEPLGCATGTSNTR